MSTLQSIISAIDKDKINSYDEQKKTQWINEINAIVHSDIHHSVDAYQDLVFPDDSDTELIVKAPYDKVYEYYVYAMIDMLNMEFQSYNNYMTMYNTAYSDYAKYYIRHNMPTQVPITNLGW